MLNHLWWRVLMFRIKIFVSKWDPSWLVSISCCSTSCGMDAQVCPSIMAASLNLWWWRCQTLSFVRCFRPEMSCWAAFHPARTLTRFPLAGVTFSCAAAAAKIPRRFNGFWMPWLHFWEVWRCELLIWNITCFWWMKVMLEAEGGRHKYPNVMATS